MLRVGKDPLAYEFSRHTAPRARISPGDTVIVETEDALSGQIRKAGDRRDKTTMPFSNPLTGPLFVDGAEHGHTLAVTIHSITPTIGQCATYTARPGPLAEWLGSDCPHGAHVCPIRDGQIFWSDDLTIPFAPMLGCIGTTPAWGSPTTVPAGPYGGNLDLVEVCPGNTVCLPVYVAGALLYVGDAHAAMGHGELSATGLEMPAETRLTVDLIKNKPLAGPRIDAPDEIMTVATGRPTERALAEAYARLILWMESDFHFDRWKAYDLLTHVARVSIGYYGFGTVAVKIGRRYLRHGPTASPFPKKGST